MVIFTAQATNDQGQIEDKKFELRNPELEQWLDDVGDGLNGSESVDE